MKPFRLSHRQAHGSASHTLPRLWAPLALALIAIALAGCYNNNTGEANIGGAIHFKLPAFPESGANAVEIFNEMHYQPSYRSQEGPRLLPPPDSVPVTGKELRYATLEEYQELNIPAPRSPIVRSREDAGPCSPSTAWCATGRP